MSSYRPPYLRVHSELPFEDLWTWLRRFEVVGWVSEHYGVSPENAEAVADCVRQARDYFETARSSSLLTRPVLLYYGMTSLCKLILLLDPSDVLSMMQIEEFERDGHGLLQWDTPAQLERKRAKQADPTADAAETFVLEDAVVEITANGRDAKSPRPRGLFPQLATRISGERALAWVNQAVSVKDLLRAVPQLDTLMQQAFGEGQGYRGLWADVRGYSVSGSDEPEYRLAVQLKESGISSVQEAQERAPYLDTELYPFVEATHSGPDTCEIAVDPAHAHRLIAREELASKCTTVLPPALLGARLDNLLAQYMLMYALSIIARYKPHRWARILEGRQSPLLPVLERLMFVAGRWWPNLVLNRLTGAWVTFAPPTYWG